MWQEKLQSEQVGHETPDVNDPEAGTSRYIASDDEAPAAEEE